MSLTLVIKTWKRTFKCGTPWDTMYTQYNWESLINLETSPIIELLNNIERERDIRTGSKASHQISVKLTLHTWNNYFFFLIENMAVFEFLAKYQISCSSSFLLAFATKYYNYWGCGVKRRQCWEFCGICIVRFKVG